MPQEPPGAGRPGPPTTPSGRPASPSAEAADSPPRPRFSAAAERAQGDRRASGPARPSARPDGDRRPDGGPGRDGPPSSAGEPRARRRRLRKVRRVVRHIDPWSVLKLSVLFYLVLFLIVCVASAVLWSAGRQTGAIENVEDFITELGVFGECEPIEGGPADDTAPTTTTLPDEVDQLPIDPTEDPVGPLGAEVERDDDGCVVGEEEFVGSFRFEGDQLFQAFVLGGLVLVLAGAAGSVVLAVLFNLISDLTGGVRVTVLEEPTAVDGSPKRDRTAPPPAGDGAPARDRTGSPPARTGG